MKKVIKSLLVFLLVFSFALVCGCGEDARSDVGDDIGGIRQSESYKSVVEEDAKIIYTSRYDIYSKDISTVINKINSKLRDVKGYISSSNVSSSQATITYRVPVANFEEFLDYIDSLEGIGNKQITSENVTQTFNEYKAHIDALEASKAAYEELLKRDNLSIYEIEELYDKITDINKNLLYYSNMLDSLNNSVSYTYVNVRFYQQVQPIERSEFVEFFKNYGQYLVDFVVIVCKVILYLVPFAVIAGVVLLIIFKPFKKAKEKKKNLNNN